jgi:RND family efflux transporter MFP subunit
VAASDLDDASSKVQVAEAQVAAAEATAAAAKAEVKIRQGKLEHAKAALKTASAAVRSAHSVMDKAHIQTEFTQLKAAFDGVVTRRTIDPGNFVQPSDSRLLRPLLTVQSIDRVRIAALVTADQARSIQRGLPVELEIDGAGSIPGQKIARFSPTLDNENHTMIFEIDFDNTGEHRLLPGMSGRVTTQKEALTIPSSCVVVADNQPFVFIVRDGKAHRAKVDAILGEPDTDVIKGFQASDLVITNPAPLKDGSPVKIENSP